MQRELHRMMDPADASEFALTCHNVTKVYREGSRELVVLQGVSLSVTAGSRVAIVGRSGSGKSTLLHILAGLDTATAGEVNVAGRDMTSANSDARAAIRGAHMGFVYQNHHLLPEFSAVENVAMPLRIAGLGKADAMGQAMALLEAVGLQHRLEHLPHALSGGERQRVAVARALAGRPTIVLADEPTGNLDAENAAQVMELMARLAVEQGTAFLVVTHDRSMLGMFDRVHTLVDGQLDHDDDKQRVAGGKPVQT
jgi:lipoprotein-releasing system ATP-binding protein